MITNQKCKSQIDIRLKETTVADILTLLLGYLVLNVSDFSKKAENKQPEKQKQKKSKI